MKNNKSKQFGKIRTKMDVINFQYLDAVTI